MSCCHGNETLNDNSSALVALCMERLMGLFAMRETFTLPHQSPVTRLIRPAQVMVKLVNYHHTYGNQHFLSLQADSPKHICRIRAKNFISQTIKIDMLRTHTWHYLHVVLLDITEKSIVPVEKYCIMYIPQIREELSIYGFATCDSAQRYICYGGLRARVAQTYIGMEFNITGIYLMMMIFSQDIFWRK